MKLIAIILVLYVTICLTLAFPVGNIKAIDESVGDFLDNAVSSSGTGDASTTSQTGALRPSRHLLKKLFHPEPQVLVQPIVVQPQNPFYSGFNPYIGSGRGYGYSGFPYNRPVGY